MFSCVLSAPPALAERDPEAARAAVREMFDPPVKRLANEPRVARLADLKKLCKTPAQQKTLTRWLERQGFAVLRTSRPGLTLHFYAQGIEKMTPVDLIWEGLPRQAKTMQALIDQAIAKARKQRRPIKHLIIAGHAGLPGCSAFGGTLDDCTFEGKLTTYQRRQLTRLRPYLAKDAEIELRQCVTGRGKQGQKLLTAIHQTTGVAASSYLADFHFGDANNHPRVIVSAKGYKIIDAEK